MRRMYSEQELTKIIEEVVKEYMEAETFEVNKLKVDALPFVVAGTTIGTGENQIVIGGSAGNLNNDDFGIAIGKDSVAQKSKTIAIGWYATATGKESVAIGMGASASNEASIAIGRGNLASNVTTVAIGNNNVNKGRNCQSIGNFHVVDPDTFNTFVGGAKNFACANHSEVTGYYCFGDIEHERAQSYNSILGQKTGHKTGHILFRAAGTFTPDAEKQDVEIDADNTCTIGAKNGIAIDLTTGVIQVLTSGVEATLAHDSLIVLFNDITSDW